MTKELFNLIGAVAIVSLGAWMRFNGHRKDDDGCSYIGSILFTVGLFFLVGSWFDLSATFPSGAIRQVQP